MRRSRCAWLGICTVLALSAAPAAADVDLRFEKCMTGSWLMIVGSQSSGHSKGAAALEIDGAKKSLKFTFHPSEGSKGAQTVRTSFAVSMPRPDAYTLSFEKPVPMLGREQRSVAVNVEPESFGQRAKVVMLGMDALEAERHDSGAALECWPRSQHARSPLLGSWKTDASKADRDAGLERKNLEVEILQDQVWVTSRGRRVGVPVWVRGYEKQVRFEMDHPVLGSGYYRLALVEDGSATLSGPGDAGPSTPMRQTARSDSRPAAASPADPPRAARSGGGGGGGGDDKPVVCHIDGRIEFRKASDCPTR